ncbi:hypothetical protein, partial [Acidovorax sp. SRB_24]|uniref:hypothetical protein n=1 Tax=Acidovorax sp. SRB_24 TaxID=1962700 RepID=UPI00197BA488
FLIDSCQRRLTLRYGPFWLEKSSQAPEGSPGLQPLTPEHASSHQKHGCVFAPAFTSRKHVLLDPVYPGAAAQSSLSDSTKANGNNSFVEKAPSAGHLAWMWAHCSSTNHKEMP